MSWIKYNDKIEVEPELGILKRNAFFDKKGRLKKEKNNIGSITGKRKSCGGFKFKYK